jgi:hypothetical protein
MPAVGGVDPGSALEGQGGAAISCEVDAGLCPSLGDAGVGPTCIPTGSRDCTSELDNDCDGQPDDNINDVCVCTAGSVEPCDEHPGLDGQGSCRAGVRVCRVDEATGVTAWGDCEGAVGPGAQDTCAPSDDTDCDGTPNEGCSCVDGQTQPCGSPTDTGPCQIGTSTCVGGTFGPCVGAVAPEARDSCSAPNDDSNCNGIANEGCSCIDGQTQRCGVTDTGPCQRGLRTCSGGVFGQCIGAVNPAQADSCSVINDANCNGSPNDGCDCIVGRGNGPCSGDANNSRCNNQGQCVPCESNADCSLVSGGRDTCVDGVCGVPLLSDGSTCTANDQCASGRCLDWFSDQDADGFGTTAVTFRSCGTPNVTPPPNGLIATSGDCCDTDADAHPGQTQFFNVPRDGCRGFDYDCRNGEEKGAHTIGVTACEQLMVPNCQAKLWTNGTGAVGIPAPPCGTAGGATFCGSLDNFTCTAISGGETLSSCR